MLLAHSRTWALCFLLAATTACDVLVREGETVMLGNAASFFGVDTPNAAFVLPEGTLIVDNAVLTGRGKVVSAVPLGPFPTPGAAIVSTGGVVDIRNGRITGGNVLVNLGDPNALPPAEGFPGPNVVAPALLAAGSDVSISGGVLSSSSVVGDSLDPYTPSPALVAVGSAVAISGGSFQVGSSVMNAGLSPSIDISQSAVAISGGSFGGVGRITSSSTLITGGSFSIGLGLGTTEERVIPVVPGCTEVVGGFFSFGIDIRGQDETLFIFGNSFDRGFGPLSSTGMVTVTGTRLDDSALNLTLFVGAGTRVVLASPDDSGCGFGS